MIIQYIPEEKVLEFAFQLIKKSKKSLYLTMIMREELMTTSKEYLDLLKRKILQGVFIRRVGFGNKKEFEKANKQLGFTNPSSNFKFRYYPDLQFAQRMLIVDKKEMLFAVYSNKFQREKFERVYTKNNRFVFYIRRPIIIKGFTNFFNEIFRKGLK